MVSKLLTRLKYLFFHVHNDWEIGIVEKSINHIIENKNLPKVKWIKSPMNTTWADPFGIKHNNQYYIFYEDLKKGKHGIINCMILDSNFKQIENRTIIDEGAHFSFPQVFKLNGAFYMLPETCSKNKLSLYKCKEFPWSWEEETTLLNIACVDSILFEKDGLWHLFYKRLGEDHKSFLRVNENLKSNWENTTEILVSESKFNCRNAGQVVHYDNKTFRISQNCKSKYGESIVINQILKMKGASYEEKVYHEIKTNSKTVSCYHTLNACEDISLIDRRRERYFLKSLSDIMKPIVSKLKA